jgi:hypothetical protein
LLCLSDLEICLELDSRRRVGVLFTGMSNINL